LGGPGSGGQGREEGGVGGSANLGRLPTELLATGLLEYCVVGGGRAKGSGVGEGKRADLEVAWTWERGWSQAGAALRFYGFTAQLST